MGKEKKFKVTITDEMFYEDLIWMSYRYCIGRKTIAAVMHAGNIAKNVYGVLSKERQQFMAHDIRREINDRIAWLRNVHVTDFRNHIPQDALSTIIYRILEKYGDKPYEWVFTDVKYSVENGKVEIDKIEKTNDDVYTFVSFYDDLIGWVKLANLLDDGCHKIVVTEYEGEIKEYKCFPWPYLSKTYNGDIILDKKWVVIDRYLENPFVDSYVASEFIKEIKEIE